MYLYVFCALLFMFKINYGYILHEPASADIHHILVQPVLYHGRDKRQIATTKHTDGLHHPKVTMTVDIDGEPHVLDLRLNTDLVTGDHVISYQKNGETILHKPTMEELDLCQYSGRVRDKAGSWVAVSTCHGVRGIIHDGKQMRYIEPAKENNINSTHYVYNYSDLSNNFFHRFDKDINVPQDINFRNYYEEQDVMPTTASRFKRDTEEKENVLKGPFGANQDSRYLELVLVADKLLYNSKGKNMSDVHKYLKETANIISSLFAQLNIFVVLVGVVVWNERDEINVVADIDVTLKNFLIYRNEKLAQSIPNDNAQLVTNITFNNSLLSRGFLGTMCTKLSAGINMDMKGLLASSIAHTIGHNLGMNHYRDCTCEGNTCIMSPIMSTTPSTHWSYCAFADLTIAFTFGLDFCLRNKPRKLYGPPSCGNGFVDTGEQCDCGVFPDGRETACAKCCNPNTCHLLPNATCATGECCDTLTCQPIKSGAVCREAKKECDLPEYCNGLSEYCPQDVYKMDTTPCSNGQGYCFHGKCGSHTEQCQWLWGPTGKVSNKLCYTTYNNINIAAKDALCGVLHCQYESDSIFKQLSHQHTFRIASYEASTIVSRFQCISIAHFNDSLSDQLLGLVQDGAKCGKQKVCLNRKCVTIASIQENITKLESSMCPSNCSGHGVCNSKGHCHCDLGFSPPYCERVIAGGSLDSGPVLVT